jgi:hypothetical protein
MYTIFVGLYNIIGVLGTFFQLEKSRVR